MNKFLKLTGVSVLAIMTANGANAAGYTCEELIEYTSCNTGRALVDGDCVCDAGYYTNGDTCTICQAGTYSSVNASECAPCPQYTYTNASGQSVTVDATSAAGATSANACYIGSDTYFTDITGTYHFKSSCAYSVKTEQEACLDDMSEEGATWDGTACSCNAYNAEWIYNPATGVGVCNIAVMDGYPYADCLSQGGTWDYDNMTCNCPINTTFEYNNDGGDYYFCDMSTLSEEECVNAGGTIRNGAEGSSCACENGNGWKLDSNSNPICE